MKKNFGNAGYDVLALVSRHLPLRQIHPRSFNVGEITQLQGPTLQKQLLLQGLSAPPQVPVASVAYSTIGTTCALSNLGS